MTLRRIVLTTHLYLALAAAPFLIALGLTGSVIAFENDIPHWLHPSLFYVRPSGAALSEQELIRTVERRFAPATVQSAQILRSPDLARVFQLSGGLSVFVNPYDGTILGTTRGGFASDRLIQEIHQIHLRLVPRPQSMPQLAAAGKVVVSYAGLVLCALVPTGLVLFWRTRRATVRWRGPWFRVCFDLHHVVGVGAALFLWIAAITGILIGFPSGERLIYAATGSTSPRPLPSPRSAAKEGSAPLNIDQILGIARAAMAGAVVTAYAVPPQPTGAFTVQLRVPAETSEAVHSSIVVDQYSGAILQTRDFRTDSAGYYWIRFNRSLHTGDIWGLPSHILAAITSLLLVVMVLTGVVIWWRKLAV